MIKVSVIVPVYNVEKYISKCLDSLVNQTFKNFEIIIVNDGSTDNSEKIIQEYLKNNKNMSYFKIKNSGQAVARNLGIKKSKGNLITFVDSDDYIDSYMLEKLYDNMKATNSDISICNLYKVYGDKTIKFLNYNKYTDDEVVNYMISHSGPVGRLYKKSLFVDNNIYFLENCIYEDLATIPLLGIYAKKISYIDDCLYYYIIRKNSSMNQLKYTEKLEDIFIVMDYLNNEFKNRDGKYNDVIEYLNIEHLLYSAFLRFLSFDKGIEKCIYISNYINKNYPYWDKNKIYLKKSIKFKLFCKMASKKKFFVCKLMKKVGDK